MSEQISLLYPNSISKSTCIQLDEAAAENLQLPSLAAQICPYNTSYALQVLSSPLTDTAAIRYRQDIFEDFRNVPELSAVLYRSLHTIYINAKSLGIKPGSTQSFFELSENAGHITAFIGCVNSCHEFYEKYYARLTSEGMKAVVSALEQRWRSEEFRGLVKEMEKLQSVLDEGIQSVTFGVNLDRYMRPAEVALLSVSKEPFRERSMFEKLFSKQQVTEPVSAIYCRKSKEGAVVEINRRLFEELDKLGGGYTKHFNAALNAYYSSSVDFLIKLEPQINFYAGAVELYSKFEHLGLPVCRPEIIPSEERIFRCRGMYDAAFAVRVFQQRDMALSVHPNDCAMDDNGRMLILTGPNNGGKTTYTRAIGINHVLAQCGLYIPGESAEISPVDRIFVHFPREEQVGINSSRFTEECKEFSETAKTATDRSLVLMNESLSSTTPSECLVISAGLMKIFARIGVRLIFTTHIHDLLDEIDSINSTEPRSKLMAMSARADENGAPLYVILPGAENVKLNAEYIFKKYGFENIV